MFEIMISDKRRANAIGGKTARACDSCLLKRARWYCTADDAFLCQSCDTFVHSANQLASRHKRVRLGTTPTTSSSAPTWHQGFTKKARTPRHNNKSSSSSQKQQPLLPLVPEIGNEDDEEISPFDESNYEDQAALLYQVPVFEPFGGELCDVPKDKEEEEDREQRNNNTTYGGSHDGIMDHDLENFSGFLPSDMELAEFAADVESLLGGGGRVKVEDQEEEEMIEEAVLAFQFDPTMEVTRGAFEWNFDYESSVVGEEDYEEEKVMADVMETKKITSTTMMMMMNSESEEAEMKRRKISLKLDYSGVVTAWANQGCPWTTGIRPDYNPDDCWPDLMVGMCPTNVDQHQLELGDKRQVGMGDGAREAKVLRYKERRRTRLFSKKIRYEVRKLNAEKRPRLRGRFVKRSSSSFTGPACFS